MIKLKQLLPEFYEEIRTVLVQTERNDLASQLPELAIVKLCHCDEPGCGSFTVGQAHPPDSFEVVGPKQSKYVSSLPLKVQKGKISLGLDQLGRITFFEVRNRPDIRRRLFRRR